MVSKKVILQLFAVLLVCFIIYLLCKHIVFLGKKNRLNEYSLNIDNKLNENFFYKFVFKFSKVLESMVIFNGVARTYDKYIIYGHFKKGMDYISLKLILGFLFSLLYIFDVLLFKNDLSLMFIILVFVIGFVIPDFYCIYENKKGNKDLENNVLDAVIILCNCLKSNYGIMQSVGEVVKRTDGFVKMEFLKVENDLKLGIGLDESFNKMYNRTGLKVIKDISNRFLLVNKGKFSFMDAFDDLGKSLIEEKRFKNEVEYLKKVNKLSYIIFAILPLLFVVTLIMFNENYLGLLCNDIGGIIILIFAIAYILYVFILYRMVRGKIS